MQRLNMIVCELDIVLNYTIVVDTQQLYAFSKCSKDQMYMYEVNGQTIAYFQHN